MARFGIIPVTIVLGLLATGCTKKPDAAPESASNPSTPNVVPKPEPTAGAAPSKPKSKPDPTPEPPPSNPRTDPTPPKPKPEPAPESPLDPKKFVATDLTRCGLRATMDLPEGCDFQVGWISAEIEKSKNFKLKIEKAYGTLAEWKEKHKKDGDTILEETPNACFVEYSNLANWYQFRADLTIDELHVSIVGWLQSKPRTVADSMWAALKSLRRTAAQEAADKTRATAIQKLAAAKVSVGKAQIGGVEVRLGFSEATAANIALLAEVPDIGEISMYCGGELPTDAFKPLAKLTGLRKLDLSSRHITNDHLASLIGHVSLEKILLDRTSVTDAGLVHVGTVKNLKTLGASGSPLTDQGLNHLAGLTRLELVYLHGAQIRGPGLKFLSASTKLKWLTLNECPLTDDGVQALHGLPVQHLDLSNTPIGDVGLVHIGNLSEITQLNLSNTRVTDAGLKHLAKLPLYELRLAHTAVTGRTLTDLLPGKNLHSIYLTGSNADDEAMVAAVRFPNLSTFSVCDTHMTDAALKHLEAWPVDRELDLDTRLKHGFSPAAVEQLQKIRPKIRIGSNMVTPKEVDIKPPVTVADLPKPDPEALFKRFMLEPIRDEDAPGKPVVELSLINDKITDRDLAELRELKTLKSLWISSDKVTDAGLAYLSGLTGLESLTLSGDGVTGSGFVHLKGLTNLRRLRLPSQRYTAAQLTPLANLKNLEHFDPSWQSASSPAAISVYKQLPKLQELSLDGVVNLDLEQLGPLPALKQLDLHGLSACKLDERGLAVIAKMPQLKTLRIKDSVTERGLRQLTALTELEVLHIDYGWEVTEEGVAEIGKLTKLRELWIGKSHLTDAGLQRLTGLTNLTSLSLPESEISDAGLEPLAKMSSLRFLGLEETRITDAGIAALARIPNLATVDLNGTRVTAAGVKKLQSLKPDLRVRHPSTDN